jgi:hypothetical protein
MTNHLFGEARGRGRGWTLSQTCRTVMSSSDSWRARPVGLVPPSPGSVFGRGCKPGRPLEAQKVRRSSKKAHSR